jgi:hypothetical protein
MSNFKRFASFVLAATIVPALPAEPRCPGNVASVTLHLTNRHQTIVAVSVNHSGPYNFLLDTGRVPHLRDSFIVAKVGHFRGSENPVTLSSPMLFRSEALPSSNWSGQK